MDLTVISQSNYDIMRAFMTDWHTSL